MRPERYLYAVQDFEVPVEIPSALLAQTQSPTSDASILEYLRGYRDACSQIYEIVRNAKLGGGSGAAGVSEATALEWNLEVTGVLRSSATGQGIRIAILDTGIDPNHPDFTAGRILMTESFIDGEDVNDGHSHGTHCAGTAAGPRMPSRPPRYGAAFESGLLIAKVLGNAGRAAESSVLDGLNWAIENGANIISMSLAGRVNPGAPADPLFEEVAKDALDEGILIIAAAGNDSRRDLGLVRPVSHPANCPSVMAVGSVGPRLKVSAFSNGGMNTFGGGIDIAAPGEGILSSIPTRMGFYGRKNGTSMATPLVAGIAAMYAQNDPKLRGQALWDVLVRSSLPLQEAGDAVGAGLVQAPH
jgi:subtilisin family serine protease